MQVITGTNRTKAIEVLNAAFDKNPGVLWVIKKDKKFRSRLQELCTFCMDVAMKREGAYITENEQGVALIYENDKKAPLFFMLRKYIRLGNKVIGWDRAWSIIRRESEIRRRKPSENHLHFWMIAVNPEWKGLETIIELRDFSYELSDQKGLPIFAEATEKKTKVTYERYGFKVFDEWKVEAENIHLWFLRRDPLSPY